MDDQKHGSTATGGIPEEVLAQILPLYGFKRRGGARPVLFAAVMTAMEEGMTEHRSAIFSRGPGGWSEAALGGADLGTHGWSFTGRAEDRPDVWGIAEIDVAGPGPSLELLSSEDGATWRYRALDKVSRFASFVSLHVSRDGRGAITTELTPDAPEMEADGLKPGFYTHTTTDGGGSWSTKASFSEKPPPPPDGGALGGPDVTYNFDEPPGAARVRELLNELES